MKQSTEPQVFIKGKCPVSKLTDFTLSCDGFFFQVL